MGDRGDHDLVTKTWAGPTGVEQLSASDRFAVPDPSGFRAEWRHGVVDGVEVGAWVSSPMAGVMASTSVAGTIMMLVVTEGAAHYGIAGGTTVLALESALILTATTRMRFALGQRTRILRFAVPATFLSPAARAALTGQVVGVQLSGVITSLISLAEQVLDPLSDGAAGPAARALRPLAIAALEDSLPLEDQDLRRRIVDHIERRLQEPDLDPQSIADDFGISLRWAHHVFDNGGDSIARHIRNRRLELVAAQLRQDRRFPRIAALAETNGFGARDNLTRAFKARFGITIGEYAALAHERRGSPEDHSQDAAGAVAADPGSTA